MLPAGLAMTGAAIAFASLYLAAGALTPLLVSYKQQWDFPAALLTVAFAVYTVGFLLAALTLGSLSDHLGRRPVLLGVLLVQLASSGLFLVAPDVGWVIAGRIVQGIAGGAATSAFTAAGRAIPADGASVTVAGSGCRISYCSANRRVRKGLEPLRQQGPNSASVVARKCLADVDFDYRH